MKKRVVVSIGVILVIAAVVLMITIFQLYKEAEKVQRSIFANEVLSAGSEVVETIDQLIIGDTIAKIDVTKLINDTTTSKIREQKFAKRFILDTTRTKPIGLIQTTINYMENNIIIEKIDTIMFDSTYLELFSPYLSLYENKRVSRNRNSNIDASDSQIDSATMELLNRDYIYRIVKGSLVEQNINAPFTFAIYNAFTTQFVVSSPTIDSAKMLKSEFIFSLKPNDRIRSPHYLIIDFESERRIFFQRMGVISGSIILLMLIITIIFIYTLRDLYVQKKISDIKNDFINNMTHEFKTPISSISIATEALKDKDIRDSVAISESYLTIITEENNRLKEMVNNILQIAQLKKGQLKINVERLNINDVIATVCDNFALQISSHKGKLEKYLYAQNPIIYGDKHHLENVIINIIENAIKYSFGEPNIVVRSQNEKKSIAISISDSGIGIARKNIKKIFSDFYREHSGNIHTTKGYGLGLGYVKKIVELHDGTIQVNSTLGKGSEFVIYIPYKNLSHE